jgi:hypothetical protein
MSVSSESPHPELAVVMPIYNEAANISVVLREWFNCLDKVAPRFVFFAINDGSTKQPPSSRPWRINSARGCAS